MTVIGPQFQLGVEKDDGSDALCPVWGDCRLQDLAYRYQVTGEAFQATPARYPMETVNPFIVRDFSRCILCGRCVQACNEVQVNNAISFGYRGANTKIIAAGDRPAERFRLRFLRRVRAGLPGGGPGGKGCALPRAALGDRKSAHHMQLLRRGLPA
jgi:ferredoxin